MIVSDGDRVFQIVSNLLSNAFRWTPDGGRVELALERGTGASRSRSRTRGRGSSRPTRSGSSGRSGRATAPARASGWRSRASSRSRSAAGSSSRASPGTGAGSTSSAGRPAGQRGAPRIRPMAATAVAERPLGPRAALAAMRPRQWTKNLLLFAGLLFAASWATRPGGWRRLLAFVAYCAASSAAYLANDVRDAADDRAHPVKRLRPVASGELPVRVALVLAGRPRRRSPWRSPPSSARGRSRSWPGSSRSRPRTPAVSSTSC